MTMDIGLIIKSVVGLIVVLAVLIIVFILPIQTKKKKDQERSTKSEEEKGKMDPVLSFDELRLIIRKRSSTTEELNKAVDQIVHHYGKIQPKLGIRSHPEFDKYVDVIVHLVRHKNTNKDLILKLDRELTRKNPDYKAELNDTLTKALNSR